MKSFPSNRSILQFGIPAILASSLAHGNTGGFTERATDASIRARQQASSFPGVVKHEVPEEPRDITTGSDFIAFDGTSTLVPKGAILHVPPQFSSSIVAGPVGRLVVWTEFLPRNSGRIQTLDITIEEALGRRPIDPARIEAAKRSNTIVIAVLGGNPASVSPPRQADQSGKP